MTEYSIFQCCVCLELASNAERVTNRDSEDNQWLTKLQNVVPEVVWMGHYTICKSCTYSLDVAYEFRALCRRLENLRTKTLLPPIKDDFGVHKAGFLDRDHPYARCPQTILTSEEIKTEKKQEQPEAEPPEDTKIDIQLMEFPEEMKTEVVQSFDNIKTEPMELSDTDAEDAKDQFSSQLYDPETAEEMVDDRYKCEIEAAAEEALLGLLPSKSKQRYQMEYEIFESWMLDKKVNFVNETVLLAYFSEKSKKYQSSSLWSKYSMIKRTLLVKKDIDISKYRKLTSFLKNNSVGHEAKKAMVLSKENVIKFLKEAPNEMYLMIKVALVFGIYGACRREELANMSTSDVDDRESVIIVTIPKTKTNKKRVFTIVDDDIVSGLELYKKYVALRPNNVPHRRFFLQYRNNLCTIQPVGKNTFGSIPRTIATFLQLPNPEKYTGHTFRRTSATLLADSGADITSVKRHGGWKSTSVAEGYLEDSIEQKNKIALLGTEERKSSGATFKIVAPQSLTLQEHQQENTETPSSSIESNSNDISVGSMTFNNLSVLNCI